MTPIGEALSLRAWFSSWEWSVPAWLNDLTYSRLFAWFVHWPLLLAGVVVFQFSGRTPWAAYWSMRRLYCVTRGRSNRSLVRMLARIDDREPPATTAGVLADLGQAAFAAAVETIRHDGFVVLGQRLSKADIESVIEFARTTPARLMPTPPSGPAEACFDASRPLAIKYDLPEQRLVEHPVVQRLLVDESLRDLARRYLGCEPVNDLVAMWWSTDFSREASSEVAQLYHFDMDRPQFLKIFIYLTDVTSETGPHCYIRSSHRERPDPLWRDGRQTDAAILSHYPADREIEITSPRGTMIAVDTSGFHKGKPLVRGHRLILQFEYTSALFGTVYERIRVPSTEFWRSRMREAPHFFSRFSLRS